MLTLDFTRLLAGLEGYGWAFLRVTGFMLLAPVFGAALVPRRVKLVLALALTLILAPLTPATAAIDPFSATALLTAAEQVLVGVAIAFVVQVVFDALSLAGQLVATTMGLGFATMIDPARGASTAVVSQFYLILGMLIFLALDGHIALISVLADSFRVLPPGPAALGPESFLALARWGGRIFEAGTMIALPAVVGLVLVNLALGIVSRAAPQLNLFAVGFPISMLLGFTMLMLSLPTLQGNLERLFLEAIDTAGRIVGTH
ncbi:MAG TPA: flagellar biosynthetic protein FliR [Steroidobacteraceae bacterium]|nr:flagellar biosynthetic protein FliR [Steroidobacteraceae bacterium]